MSHTTPKTDCPLGSDLQRYWDRLSPKERQMSLDREALYSLSIQEVARTVAAEIRGQTVIDAFCGAGGNAIALASAGKKVIAVELDTRRLEMAQQNARLFGVSDRISFFQGDSSALMKSMKADAVFLDMPWGGPDYYKKEQFGLDDFKPAGSEMIRLALALADEVAIKLPRNFDFSQFQELQIEVRTFEDKFNGHHLGYTAILTKGIEQLSIPAPGPLVGE